MSLLNKGKTILTTWITSFKMNVVVVVVVVVVVFGLYVYTEKANELANRQRQAGFQLVDQLRQSSDDLTLMARLYVVTGDPRYKQYYQSILDIRNGKMARPEGYTHSYSDLVISGDLAPSAENDKGIPLTDLIQQSGFTEDEVGHLLTAENNSDALTKVEFEAIALVEALDTDEEANRLKARQLLFSEHYNQAKSKIMQPINTFYSEMYHRTLSTANQAIAKLFLLIFIVSLLFAIVLLWRSYVMLKKLLGGTTQEVHQLISNISAGNLSSNIAVNPYIKNSVMFGLVELQAVLLANHVERTQSARILQNNLARLQAMFETHAIAIVIIDKSNKIEAFNFASEELFGYTRAEVLGCNVNILMPEPYHSEHDGYIDHYVKTGQKKIIGIGREVVGKRKNGTTFAMQLLVGDQGSGEEACYIGFIQDITERKCLEANSKLYELMVKNSDDAIITKNLDGTITSWNPSAQALFGYRAEEIIGQSVYKLLPTDCYDEEAAVRAVVSQKKSVRQLETVRLHKNGSLLNVSITLSPIVDETDTVIGISKVVRDIHELKQSLAEIQTLVFYDQLTRLPNRHLLLERLKTALPLSEQDQQYGAVLYLDIDKFKAFNDSQGHAAGDKLLVEITTRLQSCVRETETVARLGADEFVVLLESLGTEALEASNIVAHVAEQIRITLSAPYTINDFLYHGSSSIGVYLFLGRMDSVDEVIKRKRLTEPHSN